MINDLNPRNIVLATCLMLALPVGLLSAAEAQNREADLARENERLRGQNDDLEAALAAAIRKIETLEKRVQELESAPGQTTSPTPVAVETPEASPDGLVKKVAKAYDEAVASGEIKSPISAPDDASRSRAIRELRKWIAATNRKMKQRIEWPVLITDMEQTGPTSARIQVTPWNPKDQVTCGDPFVVAVPPRVLEKVRRSRLRSEGETPIFMFLGVFEPKVSYNPERTEIGAFNNPRYIAPGVEMRWGVDFKSISDYDPSKKSPIETRNSSSSTGKR